MLSIYSQVTVMLINEVDRHLGEKETEHKDANEKKAHLKESPQSIEGFVKF